MAPWWLFACTSSSSESVPLPPEKDSGADSPTDSDPPVQPGPDCTDQIWPISTPFNVLGQHLLLGQASSTEIAELDQLIVEYMPGNLGPWRHWVWGPMKSPDGVHFSGEETTVLQKASVPELVYTPDGNLWLFYVDGDLERLRSKAAAGEAVGPGLRGFGGLAAAVSRDGRIFEEVELQFRGELPLYMVDPDIVTMPDGSYQLYYLGVPVDRVCSDTPDPFATPAPHALYMATSEDLVHWEQQGVVWSVDGPGTDPAVWCTEEPACYLYMGSPGRSTDGGRSFVPFGMELGYTPMLPDAVVRGGKTMLYHRDPNILRVASSTDQRHWQDEGELGLSALGPTAATVRDETWMYLLSTD